MKKIRRKMRTKTKIKIAVISGFALLTTIFIVGAFQYGQLYFTTI